MCGIAGIYGYSDQILIDGMLDYVTHRGPDDRGRHIDKENELAMGMQRLSIIDLKHGTQPIYNEDGTVAVIFNGEIYNYRSLRKSLEASGHRFSTNSDTEVLVHLWEEYGDEMPKYLNGMFVFTVWDETKQCLFLARDRLGIKPLFVTKDTNEFAWASELQPLLATGVDTTIDQKALSDYFRLGFSPWPRTLISGVEKLPPGHSLLINDNNRIKKKYWSLPSGTTSTADNPSERVRSLLEKAIERRLQADVPVGAFLSGGIDSSSIVGLMAKHMDDLKTFSVGFEEAAYDESDEAAFVAEYFGTNHTELTYDLSKLDILPRVIAAFGEPLADPAVLPTLLLSERAREDVKVVLTGEGADELFGGSPYYETIKRHRQLSDRLPSRVFSTIESVASNTSFKPRHFRYLASLGSDKNVIETVASDFRLSPDEYMATEEEGCLPGLIQDSFEHAQSDYLHRQLTFDLSYLLPSNLLHKVDFATMQASLEARTPFLDHELVEFVHRIPTGQRFNGTYKPLLRKAMDDLLPDRTMQRTSQGFRLPIEQWFREQYKSLTRWLAPNHLKRTPFIDTDAVRSIYDDHLNGKRDWSLTLWKVVNYVGWYDLVIRPHKKEHQNVPI